MEKKDNMPGHLDALALIMDKIRILIISDQDISNATKQKFLLLYIEFQLYHTRLKQYETPVKELVRLLSDFFREK